MNNSFKFFENKECEYFPCHRGLAEFNCMFCYCPLYGKEQCPGNPGYIDAGGEKIKDCSGCTFPHDPDNYEEIIRMLGK